MFCLIGFLKTLEFLGGVGILLVLVLGHVGCQTSNVTVTRDHQNNCLFSEFTGISAGNPTRGGLVPTTGGAPPMENNFLVLGDNQ